MHVPEPVLAKMVRGLLARGSLMLTLIALVGCGPRIVYDYIPPESTEGRVCTSQCQNVASQCRQMKQIMNQQCQNNYSAMQLNYNACKESGAEHCVSPSPCPYSSTRACDQGYRECFAACGGKVIARVVE